MNLLCVLIYTVMNQLHSKAGGCGGATPANSASIAPTGLHHHTLHFKRGAPYLHRHHGNAKLEGFRWGPIVLNQ
ncbi:hypothetical protein HanXRQr2_Chr11g0467951 [Helianthus annuus]|uniref:Uncharacterized protein n=1 Tax=Helianthus annuus TaxID=4232 RepID=A0A9K3MY47_HELAN|nr:hypothetical protein HanXRQr2_Chr11g0467951 [Helianthus annuus]KAJ0873346.1 hypothetical protein HanPSC8_Chr11g0451571 [Helianthus annuus]